MAAAGWDAETDVLVVGSGAGALTAAATAGALGARAIVIEKTAQFGGTSATSGGAVWLPATHRAAEAGLEDSPEEAFQYIRALTDREVPDSKIWAYARGAREMLAWLEQNSEVRYKASPYTDYHPELPGGKMGYRTHDVLPLDARLLGDDFRRMRPPHPATRFLGRISWTVQESGMLLARYPGWQMIIVKLLARYYLDVAERLRGSGRDRFLTLGNALIGRLKLSLDKRGVPLWLNSRLVDLVSEGGRVTGAVVEREGRTLRIRTGRGVVLGAGGFERNAEMRRRYLPGQTKADWSGAQEGNSGEAIQIAMAHGAAVSNMDSAWWAASVVVPGEDRARMLTFERALPGCIVVNQAGRRYFNEAMSYHVAGREVFAHDRPGAGTVPSYILFDSRYRARYPMGPVMPVFPDWMLPANVRSILIKAGSWDELARRINVPAVALKQTVERFNGFARAGKDEDFGRGDSLYDRYYGDRTVTPNPNLRALDKPPFYAMAMWPGDLGTNGGIVTDENGQALDDQGCPLAGLYAVGNMAASVMGHSYPGAGATLGPAMYFGYAAARHLAGANR
jgi:3-oxosteroid 1-dehydrogenase